MKREWKPGDVVAFTIGGTEYRGIIDTDHRPYTTDNRASGRLATPSAIRPLVVIDPEDRGQVERLWDLVALQARANPVGGGALEDMQAALREFADPKPPRLAEPTLWGVVEATAPGIPRRRWVHHEEGRWVSDEGVVRPWELLADPDLVREGVEE